MNTAYQNQARKKRRIISEINITPFVDVLLVLLIIFMVAAPMMTGKVDVNLPNGSSLSSNAASSQAIAVSIKSDGSIYLQENQVKLSRLLPLLNQLTAGDLTNKILVRADKSLDYGRVMDVVKEIGSAGYSQVVLVTEVPK